VSAIGAIVLVAENPSDHHIFLSAFSGVRDLHSTSAGVTVETPRGAIQAMDPEAFRLHYGVAAPDLSAGARLAAAKFIVRDLAALRALLAKTDIPAGEHMGRIVIAPETALGATLVFEAG
jgi:hypothetical protein